jgi:hypothetical protein
MKQSKIALNFIQPLPLFLIIVITPLFLSSMAYHSTTQSPTSFAFPQFLLVIYFVHLSFQRLTFSFMYIKKINDIKKNEKNYGFQ